MYDRVREALTGTSRVPSPRASPRQPTPQQQQQSLLHSLATWKWSA
jgi:hypothetical protein